MLKRMDIFAFSQTQSYVDDVNVSKMVRRGSTDAEGLDGIVQTLVIGSYVYLVRNNGTDTPTIIKFNPKKMTIEETLKLLDYDGPDVS